MLMGMKLRPNTFQDIHFSVFQKTVKNYIA